MKYINDSYTVESVLCGHPDKICDQISDGLLDLYLEADKSAHTAIECLGTSDTLIVAGEVSSSANIKITQSSQLLYQQITGFKPIKVIDLVSQQSPQLETAIEHGGAGDQGVMYGYACRSKYNYLPYGYWLVNTIAKRLDSYRKETSAFLPDGKIQAVLCGNNVEKLTVNVQHKSDADLESLRTRIKNEVLYDIDAANIEIDEDTGFIRGGFENDTGLTGRKIMVDTYGGLVETIQSFV